MTKSFLKFFNDGFQYKGYYFSELCRKDQMFVERYPISMAETNDAITQKDKYEYFLALNTTGKPQDQDHMKMVQELLNKESQSEKK